MVEHFDLKVTYMPQLLPVTTATGADDVIRTLRLVPAIPTCAIYRIVSQLPPFLLSNLFSLLLLARSGSITRQLLASACPNLQIKPTIIMFHFFVLQTNYVGSCSEAHS